MDDKRNNQGGNSRPNKKMIKVDSSDDSDDYEDYRN